MEPLFKWSFTHISKLHQLASENIDALEGTEHTVKGHVRRVAHQQHILFISMFDGSHAETLQLIINDETCPKKEIDGELKSLKEIIDADINVGATIIATGTIIKSPKAGQLIEMQVTDCDIVGKIHNPDTFLPGIKNLTLEKAREQYHRRSMLQSSQSIFRIGSELEFFIHRYMRSMGIWHVDPCVISTSQCEGGSDVFMITTLLNSGDINDIPIIEGTTKIDFDKDTFGVPAYPQVSSQLPLEATCAGMGGNYTMNPSFRAEKSKTRRHLCEFKHFEAELPFLTLNDLMNFEEDMVVYLIRSVLDECMSDLKKLDAFLAKGLIERLRKTISERFARISYDEAINIIHTHTAEIKNKFGNDVEIPKWGEDLNGHVERFITEDIMKKPTFVYNFPRDLKSFYMKQNPPYVVELPDGTTETRHTMQGCDLLLPGIGEIIGGSVREERYDVLLDEVHRRNMNIKPLEWYLELRRSAATSTAGFGLGFARIHGFCTLNEANVRDVVPYPVAYRECKY